MVCPHCHQDAPLVYRGVLAYCAACSKPRAPFSAKAVNLAGQPSKIGGSVGKVVGWLVLIFGLLLAAAVMLFFQLAFPSAAIGYAIGLPIALISLVIGVLLLLSSKRLHRSGTEAERQTRLQALHAVAANRGGTLTAADAARTLGMSVSEAEALLNESCKLEPDCVSLEFDESGELFYLFPRAGGRAPAFGARYRVEPEGRVRVQDVLGEREAAEEAERESARKRR